MLNLAAGFVTHSRHNVREFLAQNRAARFMPLIYNAHHHSFPSDVIPVSGARLYRSALPREGCR